MAAVSVKKVYSRQNLLLRTDILQKTVVGCPWPELWKTTIGLIPAHFFVHFLAVVCMTTTWNVQKPPGFHVLWRKCGTCSCSLFLPLLIFFSSAIKFVFVRWSKDKLYLFENYKGFNIISPIDWPRSNSTIPTIASAALSRGRGRWAWIFTSRINPASLRSWWSVKVRLGRLWVDELQALLNACSTTREWEIFYLALKTGYINRTHTHMNKVEPKTLYFNFVWLL